MTNPPTAAPKGTESATPEQGWFRKGQMDRKAGLPCCHTNGSYLDGWYAPESEPIQDSDATPAQLLEDMIYVSEAMGMTRDETCIIRDSWKALLEACKLVSRTLPSSPVKQVDIRLAEVVRAAIKLAEGQVQP